MGQQEGRWAKRRPGDRRDGQRWHFSEVVSILAGQPEDRSRPSDQVPERLEGGNISWKSEPWGAVFTDGEDFS